MAAARRVLIGLILNAVIALPVLAGLAASVLMAFGVTPGLSGGGLSLGAWRAFLAEPGLMVSVGLTLRIGVLATTVSVVSALVIAMGSHGSLMRLMAPLLAVPHAALAIGVGFLIAPTGWLVRLLDLSPLAFATVGDRFGGAVILALWLKETPFLLLCLLAALREAPVVRSRLAAASLGYAPWRVAALVVLPRVWPQIRLPVLAVLAFSLSVTDVALILGPQTPPTLGVQILRWSDDPDLSRWSLAAAASLTLVGLTLGGFLGLHLIERMAGRLGRHVAGQGNRGGGNPVWIAGTLALGGAAIGLLGLATLVLWAGASAWRFPMVWPLHWSGVAVLGRIGDAASASVTTLWLGVSASLAALVLAATGLWAGQGVRVLWLPLLLPQAGFLFGVYILLLWARLDGTALALIWCHVLFVLPYVLLALRGPWRALDPRYARAAASLGASPWLVLVRVTLPLLAARLRTAAAIGFSVSVALYLPTLFAGAGRVDTLATLAVSLAAGSDRRLLAAAALAQAALPALAFVAATRR